jgi:hypothetical protein
MSGTATNLLNVPGLNS